MAMKYMEVVFSDDNIEGLRHILADDLVFDGPLYQFNCADDYMAVMRAAPPRDFSYELIGSYEAEASACLVYQFIKPGISTTMCQHFETAGNKISKIKLVFDTAVFNPNTGDG